ncbi:DUF4962 domain-containing protein [Flavobacterium phragmitis]|uniref:Heparinase II/III-like protein n=1 Tax=Flavobacterium phragmitis TaxID=739143 RepID=A0A1I1NKM8_9FLAO|nr:DUF4962 domain-containing protein [Flavobacterium phragmitis]SFC95283.1 Heparinase II/III-like protein [Flavobacterium phragmitis]
MKKITSLYFLLLFINVFAQQQSSVIKLTADKLHGRLREWPYPANGITVPTNSPSLLWPGTNGKEKIVLAGDIGDDFELDPKIHQVIYKVILASDKDFKQNVIAGKEQPWAMYPLHQALKPGNWYWKYAYATKGKQNWVWSPVYNFVIDSKHNNDKVTPTAEQVLKRLSGPHPRLWNMHQIGKEFYQNNRNNPEAAKFIAYAEKLMLEPLPEEKPRRFIDTTGQTTLQKKIAVESMYHGFGDMVGNPVRNLCIAYQLTKDKRFIIDAKKRALNIAKMNPDGLATRDDFTGGAILEAVGWFYDTGYDFLSEDEKKLFLKVIKLRGERIYRHLPNRFEININDNHIWQITLRNLAIGAVSASNEVPEANEWLEYIYEVWSARFPILSNTDGGWHEGSGYFKVNFRSFLYLSQMLSDLSGFDYFNNIPWMQNLPYFLLYTHPSNASCMAMGDMWEKEPGIAKIDAFFADGLTYKIDNPYLNTYVANIKKDYPNYFNGTDDLLFYRLLNYKSKRNLPESSLAELPKARLFKDVGIVAMHEDLANPDKSLSSYFFSIPMGSSGHGHASQNAFTINYKGKTIFGGTGYYSNFSDRHNLLDYRTARAYSTILADSLGQKIGENGYGWVPRFITGKHVQYALGDATNAYGPITNEFWLERFKSINVIPNEANGYGQPNITLYRRHLLQLEGGYVVLYDELEAKKPIKWTTQFQVPYYTMTPENSAASTQQNFEVKTDVGKVMTSVFTNLPTTMIVHNKFAETAVNWNKVLGPDGKVFEYKEQWHAGITSTPQQKFRFLTIIQIKDGKTEILKTIKLADGITSVKVGNWNIQAQLDGTKQPALQANNNVLKTIFNYGALPVTVDNKKYKHKIDGSSMLIETVKGKTNQQEVVDELPDVAKYDSKD